MLACADSKLIGKTFKDKKIEVTISESFYNGKELAEKGLIKLLKETTNVNLFGDECINIALKIGFIKKDDIIRINGVAHVQIYKI